jgi:hypothetical protein
MRDGACCCNCGEEPLQLQESLEDVGTPLFEPPLYRAGGERSGRRVDAGGGCHSNRRFWGGEGPLPLCPG